MANEKVQKLRAVYERLRRKEVPNVDRLTWDSSEGNTVYLEPKGICKVPTTEEELVDAVSCILEALVVMHSGPDPLYHRDIRWPNVVRRADEPSKWFLVDWEEAAWAPTLAVTELDPKSHCPTVFQDGHAGEVDVWAVGKLILDRSYSIFDVFSDWKLRDWTTKMIEYKLNAADALAELQRLYSESESTATC